MHDFSLHPLSRYLAPWLVDGPLALDRLNAAAAARGIVTGNGKPLRFVVPADDGLGYEERACLNGEVATRADNRHDLFNALVIAFFGDLRAARGRPG